MKVKELIEKLKGYGEKEILLACDEEWNTLFKDIEFNTYKEYNAVVLFGLSGSEVE